MARLLLVGHDRGAAAMLLPVIEHTMERGHAVSMLAGGPAASLWRSIGDVRQAACEEKDSLSAELARVEPDLVVTGTGHYSDLERMTWLAAQERGVPTLAAIDAWVNFPERFICTGDARYVQPDALCVIDERCRERLAADERCRARIHVTGHPHLEAVVDRLRPGCATRAANPIPLVAFFSNPVGGSHANDSPPVYDQFSVVDDLLSGLAECGPVRLEIQLHPREDPARWATWIAATKAAPTVDVRLSERSTSQLMVAADGVVGITSMALVEAALLGKPLMSLQPGRDRARNPAVDDLPGITLVTDPRRVASAVRAFVADMARPRPPVPELVGCIDRACERFMAAIEAELGGPEG